MISILQKSSFLILLDKIFGFRAWGLILYGALPSWLALLGVSKGEVKFTAIEYLLHISIFASILPIAIIFLLIRTRHRNWYLTTDFLNVRSFISTFVILILAILICGVSVIIHSENNGENDIEILEYFKSKELRKIAPQAFLLAVVSLVLSSTLFITVLTRNINLPGLPSDDFVKLLAKIRINMRKIMGSKVWKDYISLDDNKLTKLAKEIKNDMDQAAVCTGNYLAKKSLEPIREDIINLINILGEIRSSGTNEAQKIKWKSYFAKREDLSSADIHFRLSKKKQVASLERLKKLKLGV